MVPWTLMLSTQYVQGNQYMGIGLIRFWEHEDISQ